MRSEWKNTKWGEIAELKYGKGLKGYRDNVGKTRVYGTNGPIGWTNQILYDEESIIVGRKGAYRGIYFAQPPFYVIDTAYFLVKKEDFDIKWAYYNLLTKDINGLDSGSAIPSTRREDFYNLDVSIPPLTIQKKIAHILSTLDNKIELNRKMNQTLEELAQALFKSWFVDFDPVHAKAGCKSDAELETAAKGLGISKEVLELFPSEFVESEMGMIPLAWEVRELHSLVKQLKPGTNYQPKRVKSGIPFVNGKHIQNGFLSMNDIKYITEEEYARSLSD